MDEAAALPKGCRRFLDRLDDYLDQELPPEETRWMLEHLAACPACAARGMRAYEDLAEMRDAVQNFVVPDTLPERIRAALAAQ